MGSPDICLAIVNPAITTGDTSVVYQNVSATLNLTLTNNTGGAITFQGENTPSYFEVFMPQYFTSSQVDDMSENVTAPAGWKPSYNSEDQSLVLTFTGTSGTPWNDGQTFPFSIAKVLATADPDSGSVQVNPNQMTGNVPAQVQGPLNLQLPPQQGNADLTKVLQVSVDSQGSIYVSAQGDPLPNTLFLTLKNVGHDSIYSGDQKWTGKFKPTVIMTFVYGSTSGALAPDNDKDAPQIGSAWNITGVVLSSGGNDWVVENPKNTGTAPHPSWRLHPVGTNKEIIRTGEHANVVFAIENIVSFTPIGHTQMIVQFTGFPANDNQVYNDVTYVFDINKQQPPPTRGLVNFYGPTALVTVTRPDQPVTISLNWAMLYVNSVRLICSFPGMAPITIPYPTAAPLAYDRTTLTIPGVAVSTPVFLTLQSLDHNGAYLNSLQFTVFINAMEFVDPRDNKVYAVVLIDNLVWMAQNLDWSGDGSRLYNDDGSNENTYGRLYPARLASQVPPGGGWRLPSQDDWNNLIAAAGSQPYAALMAGGSSGFDAQLGGQCDDLGNFSQLGTYGYYWTATAQSSQAIYVAQFSSVSSSVTTINPTPPDYMVSVRYVRNA